MPFEIALQFSSPHIRLRVSMVALILCSEVVAQLMGTPAGIPWEDVFLLPGGQHRPVGQLSPTRCSSPPSTEASAPIETIEISPVRRVSSTRDARDEQAPETESTIGGAFLEELAGRG